MLGGLLLDNSAWDRVADMVGAGDFYRHEHRLIFEQIRKLIDGSRPADVITVFESLQAAGKAEEAGGLAYLNTLAQNTPSAANVRRYAEIVRDRSVLRRLVTRRRRNRHQRAQHRRAATPRKCSTRPRRRCSRSPSRARAASRASSTWTGC